MYPELSTDGYKIDHRRQYPKETKKVVSNCTPRKSRVPGIDKVVVFGIQYYCISTLIEDWNNNFFAKPEEEVCSRFYRRIKNYTSKESADAVGIEHIKALHRLGYLPLEIKALPEGSLCPIRVPMYTVKNTHDNFYWLTNYIETDMSCETWGEATSATTAHEYYKILSKYAVATGGNLDFVKFQGHDFSYRGMFGKHAAAMSGAGHLLSFYGTDTIPAIDWLEKYYGADSDKELVGTSVWATEHAVMCVGTGFYIRKNGLTWERYGEAEFEVFKRLITELYPTGIVSIVSDTWDLWKVLTEYLVRLKDDILARNGKVVIRPDSGNPVDIICGLPLVDSIWEGGVENKYKRFIYNSKCYEFDLNGFEDSEKEYGESTLDYLEDFCKVVSVSEPETKGVVELLWDTFGGSTNKKGFKELHPNIGCIYGDSITLERAEDICKRLSDKGFASTSWVAGIGSYTYQYVTRDTFGFAIKATAAEVEIDSKRELIEIFKDPITDDGTKKSATGLLRVDEIDGQFKLTDKVSWEEEAKGALKTVFLNSKLVNPTTLAEIRSRLNQI